jgi:hypothetical protein
MRSSRRLHRYPGLVPGSPRLPRTLIVAVMVAVVMGGYLALKSFAADAGYSWSGGVAIDSPTKRYVVDAPAPGQLQGRLAWTSSANLSLSLVDSAGQTVDAVAGRSPLVLTEPVGAGEYRYVVSWQDGTERVPFTLDATFDPAKK